MERVALPFERDETPDGASVVTITLESPERKIVVMDRDLLGRLNATLDAIGDELAGLVLSSATRVFVAGADLAEIDGLSDAELDEYLAFGQRVFGRIAAMACTSVAAIDGAALGGGLECAMHCDVIFGLRPAADVKPYLVGLPEAGLGVCPGWGGTNLLPARMDSARAIELTATGKPLSVIAAHEAGVISELFDSREELLAAARRRAAEPKPDRGRPEEPHCISQPEKIEVVQAAWKKIERSLPDTASARGVASCVRAGLERGWQAALDEERRMLIELRRTEEAQTRIGAFLNKSTAK